MNNTLKIRIQPLKLAAFALVVVSFLLMIIPMSDLSSWEYYFLGALIGADDSVPETIVVVLQILLIVSLIYAAISVVQAKRTGISLFFVLNIVIFALMLFGVVAVYIELEPYMDYIGALDDLLEWVGVDDDSTLMVLCKNILLALLFSLGAFLLDCRKGPEFTWELGKGMKPSGNADSPAAVPAAVKAPVPAGWTCSCGQTNNASYSHCTACGKAKVEKKLCLCGAELKSGSKFCSKCGRRVSADPFEDTAPAPDPHPTVFDEWSGKPAAAPAAPAAEEDWFAASAPAPVTVGSWSDEPTEVLTTLEADTWYAAPRPAAPETWSGKPAETPAKPAASSQTQGFMIPDDSDL